MVPPAKETLFSRTKLPFSGTKYTRFKGNKSRDVGKSLSYLFNVGYTLSSCLIHQPLFKFKLTWDIKTMYQYSFSSTIEVSSCRHNNYSWAYLFQMEFFSWVTFPDFVKFKDISRTWKMNLLFSSFPRTNSISVRLFLTETAPSKKIWLKYYLIGILTNRSNWGLHQIQNKI